MADKTYLIRNVKNLNTVSTFSYSMYMCIHIHTDDIPRTLVPVQVQFLYSTCKGTYSVQVPNISH